METKLLNKEAVIELLRTCISKNHLIDASGIIMCHIGEELQHICAEYGDGVHTDEWSDLTAYASLRPSDEQIRKALDLLMQEKVKTCGKREKLFYNTRQWLAVFRVLEFLKVLNGEYGCMAAMENYVLMIYKGGTLPAVACRQDAMQKKSRIAPFNSKLEKWEKCNASAEMRDYWAVAITLLRHIKMVCECDLNAL